MRYRPLLPQRALSIILQNATFFQGRVLADGRSRPAAHLDRLGEEDKITVCVLAEGRSRQVLTSSLDEW